MHKLLNVIRTLLFSPDIEDFKHLFIKDIYVCVQPHTHTLLELVPKSGFELELHI